MQPLFPGTLGCLSYYVLFGIEMDKVIMAIVVIRLIRATELSGSEEDGKRTATAIQL